ncbi:MAG: hypothetical protein ACRCSG_06070 [Cellulosilyticaceae bacterium]
MAVEKTLDEVKVVLKMGRGSQTISKCSKVANDTAYYALGQAVGSLQAESVDRIIKIEESILVME